MKSYLILFLVVGALLFCSACQKQSDSQPEPTTESTPRQVTEIGTQPGVTTLSSVSRKTTTTTSHTTAERQYQFEVVYTDVPNDFPVRLPERVDAFLPEQIGLSNGYDGLQLIALDGDILYFEKQFPTRSDVPDMEYYVFDFATGEMTRLSETCKGIREEGGAVVLHGCCYINVFQEGEKGYLVLDPRKKQAEFHPDPDFAGNGYSWLLPLDQDSFLEVRSELYMDDLYVFQREKQSVLLRDRAGSTKELLLRDYRPDQERYFYAACNGRIYSLAFYKGQADLYLLEYDLEGDLLSSSYLEEASKELGMAKEAAVNGFEVYGIHVLIWTDVDGICNQFLYNLKDGTVTALPGSDLWTVNYSTGTAPFFLRRMMRTDGKTQLYMIDQAGRLQGFSQEIPSGVCLMADGKSVVYLDDDGLYRLPVS